METTVPVIHFLVFGGGRHRETAVKEWVPVSIRVGTRPQSRTGSQVELSVTYAIQKCESVCISQDVFVYFTDSVTDSCSCKCDSVALTAPRGCWTIQCLQYKHLSKVPPGSTRGQVSKWVCTEAWEDFIDLLRHLHRSYLVWTQRLKVIERISVGHGVATWVIFWKPRDVTIKLECQFNE